jgi:hypothetical protein
MPGTQFRLRGLAFSLAAVAAFLLTVGPASAKPRTYKFNKLACQVTVPGSWKKTEMKPGEKVKFKMTPSGTFSISHKKIKLPLNKISRGVKTVGKKKGWKLLKELKNIKHRGKRAHLLSYMMPTKKKGLFVRADYFFVNTPTGYYTLFFASSAKDFKPGKYKAVYMTFQSR